MPKIIENLQSRIVGCARIRLNEYGYGSLTMRQIASDCNVAPGTLYNYYRSKEMLVGEIIFEDWKKVLSEVDENIELAATMHDGLDAVSKGLEEFCLRYSALWQEYGSVGGMGQAYGKRHTMLVSAVSERVAKVLDRFGKDSSGPVCEILAEAMITLAVHGKHYSEHADVLERMVI